MIWIVGLAAYDNDDQDLDIFFHFMKHMILFYNTRSSALGSQHAQVPRPAHPELTSLRYALKFRCETVSGAVRPYRAVTALVGRVPPRGMALRFETHK
jgi:hypothetical protein